MRDEAAGRSGARVQEATQSGTMTGSVETKPGLAIQRRADLEERDEELNLQREAYMEMQKAAKRLQRVLKLEADLEEESVDRCIDRCIDRCMELEERNVILAMDQEAERDLKRWLKWYREVGIHRDFARDYAKYTARMSC